MRYWIAALALVLLCSCEGADVFNPDAPLLAVTNPLLAPLQNVGITSFGRSDPLTGQLAPNATCFSFRAEFVATQVGDQLTLEMQAWVDDKSLTVDPVFVDTLRGAILKQDPNTGLLEFLVTTSTPAGCALPQPNLSCAPTLHPFGPFEPCCHDWEGLVFVHFTGVFGDFGIDASGNLLEVRGLLTRQYSDGTECRATINF